MGHSKKKINEIFIKTALQLSKLSKAKRLKVACLLVRNNDIISIGINGTPKKTSNNCEYKNKTLDYVIHAEVNCLFKSYNKTKKAILYLTHSPCLKCSSIIVHSGIKKVYYNKEYRNLDGLKYLKKYKIKYEKITI